ncbi:hypothetical protein RFI_25323, partial [Reticulomyxa filosa]
KKKKKKKKKKKGGYNLIKKNKKTGNTRIAFNRFNDILDFDGERVLYRNTSKDGSKNIGILRLPVPSIRNRDSTYTVPRIHSSLATKKQTVTINVRDDESDEKVFSVPLTNAKKRNSDEAHDFMFVDDKLGSFILLFFFLMCQEGSSYIKQATHVIPMNKWVLPKSTTNYSCFQMFEDKVCYVSNHNLIKVYDIKKGQVICRLDGHSHYILALEYVNPDFIVSLGSDQTIRVWQIFDTHFTSNNSSNPNKLCEWKCVFLQRNIPGHFVPGYLYKIEMLRELIVYSADNGLFAFKWTTEIDKYANDTQI